MNKGMARLAFQVSLTFLLLLLIVDGYYFVILYTISEAAAYYDINKSKLKIIMSCQSPIVSLPQNCFRFCILFFSKPTAIKLQKQRQHWIISQHFRSLNCLCYFSFDFICAFVALNFVWKGKHVEGTQAWLSETSHLEKQRTFLRDAPRVHASKFIGKASAGENN